MHFLRRVIFLIVIMFDIANCSIVVNVNKGVVKPVSIALNFIDKKGGMKRSFVGVIRKDLESTCLFRSVSEDAFMQKMDTILTDPTYNLWKIINVQYLVNIELKPYNDGIIDVTLVLYDVASKSKIRTISAYAKENDWRKMAHMMANGIYERVTGEKGYFDTKILYVATQHTKGKHKIYRLAMMDQDGHDNQYLTNGSSIVLTPRLSPKGNEFSFFSYKEKTVNSRKIPLSASVYRYNFNTRKTELMVQFKGMTYAPRYSPDGNTLIFSLSNNGASSIYTYDLVARKIRRLTKGRCIDTSPCYSPDGQCIVFNSDRGGTQQLYVMDTDGSNVRRLSFSVGRYATPVWSPRGDWIAFTKFGSSGFFIGIIRPDGTEERMLASGFLVESPTWSPNGRVVLFSHQDYYRKEQICSVDITGYNKRVVPTQMNAIDPEWSGNIKFDCVYRKKV